MLLTAHLLRLKSGSEEVMKSRKEIKKKGVKIFRNLGCEVQWVFELIDFVESSLFCVPRLSIQALMLL